MGILGKSKGMVRPHQGRLQVAKDHVEPFEGTYLTPGPAFARNHHLVFKPHPRHHLKAQQAIRGHHCVSRQGFISPRPEAREGEAVDWVKAHPLRLPDESTILRFRHRLELLISTVTIQLPDLNELARHIELENRVAKRSCSYLHKPKMRLCGAIDLIGMCCKLLINKG